MGASLGPVLANIIMTECEKKVVNKLIRNGKVKFYVRYVDDTLLLVKRADINSILDEFNKFDKKKNIRFTVDRFENSNPHFLDLEICPDGLTIYRKDTFTGQYTRADSFKTWKHNTAWIRSLVNRAKKICSKSKLPRELKTIKELASWNKFPAKVVNSIIKRVLSKPRPDQINQASQTIPTEQKVYFSVHYAGTTADQLIKKCWRKLSRCTTKKVNFITQYSSTTLSFFTNMKDKIPTLSKSYIVYEFTCPGCSASYIGLTRRTLFQRTKEHASREESAIRSHLDDCLNCEHLFSINNMFLNDVDPDDFRLNLVRNNVKVIGNADTYTLEFKEAFFIKEKKPLLNNGIKASKEFQLF